MIPRSWELIAPGGSAELAHRLGGLFGVVYFGVPLLVVVAWAGWGHRSDLWVRGSALLVAVVILLSLGPALHVYGVARGLPLPWTLLLRLPVYGLLVPARIAPFGFLGAAVCVASVVDGLWPARIDARLAWPAAMAAAVLLPLAPAGPLPVWLSPLPRYFAHVAMRALPAGGLVVIAAPPPSLAGVDAMLWQLEARFRFRLPWGYAIQPGTGGRASGLGPIGPLENAWLRLEAYGRVHIDPGTLPRIRAELRTWRADAMVVGPVPHQALVVALTSRVVERSPRWTDGVAVWVLRVVRSRTVGARSRARLRA